MSWNYIAATDDIQPHSRHQPTIKEFQPQKYHCHTLRELDTDGRMEEGDDFEIEPVAYT